MSGAGASEFVLATRGSPLALWQARAVEAALRRVHPGLEVRLVEIKTQGDRVQDRPIADVGTQGVFTVEVDRAVQDGRAHAAVHSLKDLATSVSEGLVLAAVLPRGRPEDVLVAARGTTTAALPRGATVATGSLRRRAMLLRERPDLSCVDVRGNVETRLAKLARGEADALVLARAGLERLGLEDRIAETLPVERFLPAVGQGLVAITARAGEAGTASLLAGIRDADGFACAAAERALLRTLRGGCHAPIGGHAVVSAGTLRLRARVLSADGAREIADDRSGPVADAERIGVAAARDLIARGAADLLSETRR